MELGIGRGEREREARKELTTLVPPFEGVSEAAGEKAEVDDRGEAARLDVSGMVVREPRGVRRLSVRRRQVLADVLEFLVHDRHLQQSNKGAQETEFEIFLCASICPRRKVPARSPGKTHLLSYSVRRRRCAD